MVALLRGYLWLVLLCAGTLLLLETGHCAPLDTCEEFPVFNIKCCKLKPSCSNARHVTCLCPYLDKMVLRKGDIPKSVETIHISGTRTVIVYKDAIRNLQSLTDFTLQEINNVEIQKYGLRLQDDVAHPLNYEFIEDFRINDEAFSVTSKHGTTIRFSDITKLQIESRGFDYSSTSLGPDVKLQNIWWLDLASTGFAAPINLLSLENVGMQVCRNDSFSGNIFERELSNVTITKVKSGCFSGSDGLTTDDRRRTTLSIRSSTLVNIHPRAFSGNISRVRIEESRFTTVQEMGFNIRVRDIDIIDSHIETLFSNGLSVTAMNCIQLKGVEIDNLSKGALAGIQTGRDKNGYFHPLSIRGLEVVKAEDGSLAFWDCLKLDIFGMHIAAPVPHICPTERWVKRLVGAEDRELLHPAEIAVFHVLHDRHLCPEDRAIHFPQTVINPRCSVTQDSRDDNGGDRSAHDSRADRSEEGSGEATAGEGHDYWDVENNVSRSGTDGDGNPVGDKNSDTANIHDEGDIPNGTNSDDMQNGNSNIGTPSGKGAGDVGWHGALAGVSIGVFAIVVILVFVYRARCRKNTKRGYSAASSSSTQDQD